MAQPMRALVTGARGFIGRRLVQLLVRQHADVICLDRTAESADALQGLPVQRLAADLGDADAVARALNQTSGFDVVFHLAGSTAPRSLSAARAINVQGSLQLGTCVAEQAQVPVFVYVSSLAVAGPHAEPVTETTACHPVSIYGRTKLEAEQALAGIADRLPLTIVRPPCVFGPTDRNLLTLFRSVRRGWNVYSHPDYRYSFLYVDDLAGALVAAAERGQRLPATSDSSHTGVYYVADRRSVTFRELGDEVAQLLGRPHVHQVRVPSPVGWTAATIGQIAQVVLRRRVFFNRDKAREAYGGSWMCDPSRAAEQLGFAPARDLAQRLAETRDSYLRDGWLSSA